MAPRRLLFYFVVAAALGLLVYLQLRGTVKPRPGPKRGAGAAVSRSSGDSRAAAVGAPTKARAVGRSGPLGLPAGPALPPEQLATLAGRFLVPAGPEGTLAALRLLLKPARADGGISEAGVSADRLGRYRLRMAAGAYRLALEGEGYVLAPGPRGLWIAPEADGQLDLPLERLRVLRGRVESTLGAPVSGALLRVFREPLEGGARCSILLREGLSDAAGAFSLTIPQGRVALAASSAGGVTQRWLDPRRSAPEVVLRLGAGATIDAQLLDPLGRALAGGKLVVRDAAGPREVACSDEGRCRAQGLLPGLLLITGKAAGYPPSEPQAAVVAAGQLRKVVVALPKALRLRGVLRGVKGEPVSGVWVRAMRVGDSAAAMEQRVPLRARSDAQGRFVLAPLPGLPLRIEADAGDAAALREGVVAEAGGPELELRLRHKGGIVGVLRDALGKPLRAACELLLSGSETRRLWVIPAQGRFALSGLPPGSYRLRLRSENHAAQSVGPVAVSDGANTRLELRLEAAGRVSGLVHDKAGLPLPGVRVRLVGTAAPPALTDGGGRYRINFAPTGRWGLRVEPRNAVGEAPGAPREVSVSAGELVEAPTLVWGKRSSP